MGWCALDWCAQVVVIAIVGALVLVAALKRRQ